MHSLGLSDNIAPMDDPKWLRLITIGLVLAAAAVGYFLFTGRFSSNNASKTPSQISQSSPSPSPSASVKPSVSPSPSPASAYNKIAERTTKGGQPVNALPRTGFPEDLAFVLAISTMLAGWGLRRFPR